MADSSFGPHRVFVVNGQPLIIPGDNRIDSVNSINADILQHALQDSNTHDNITVIDNNCSSFLTKDVSMDETTDDNKEYVAILGDNDNDEAPTIHLTLEQAAELGIQFEVDNCDQSTASVEKVSSSANFVLSNQNKMLFDDTNSQNTISQLTTDSSKLNVNSFIQQTNNVSIQSQITSDQPQQVTLIPQFINGTMTYTMQLPNHVNNDFLQLKNPTFSLQSNEQCNISNIATVSSTDFSLEGNLSTSIISLIQPTLSTSQVGLLSTNCIEPIMSTGMPSKVNMRMNNAPKLAYILPHTLELDSAENSKTSSTLSYTSLPQVADSMKKPRILSNGNLKQKSVLKNVALPTSNILNNTPQINNSKNPVLQELAQTTLSSSVTKINETCRTNSKSTPQQKSDEISFLNPANSSFQTKDDDSSNLKINSKSKKESEENSNKVLKTIDSRVVTSLPQEVSATFSRTPIKSDSKKPLGSNKNPIQLVQQGQTFHSMHTLTQDHIKKVITVLQQKDIDTAHPSKNVLYDAESNTRIIYRVVCPEELYLKKKTDDNVPLKRRGRPKRVRLSSETQTNGVVGSEGTAEEEQPRKKCTYSRTRSGRLSRPPKHMVRDYKRIMKLDGEESDGAYSDYHGEYHEEESTGTSANLLPGLNMKQKRNISSQFHCPTCGKIYLGFARMSRHFDKYPDHGTSEYLKMLRNSHPEFNGGGNGIWRGGGKRRGRTKTRVVYPPSFSADKLKEALNACEEQEIAAIAGPTVARILTTWELILLRIEAIHEENRVAALYRELKQLLKEIKHIAGKVFKPLDHELRLVDKGLTVEVEDELMSKVLDIPLGVYQASDAELYPSQPKIINKDKQRLRNDFNSASIKSLDYKQENLDASDYVPSDSDEEFREKNTEKTSKFTEDEDSQVLTALNIMDKNLSQSRKEQSRGTESFLLPNEEMMCVPDERDLDSVDEIVSERLQNLTGSQHQDLCKTDVDELMKGFSVLDHRIVSDAVRNESQDDLMEGFSIASRRSHVVSASTEDLIKSLEHFGSELNNSDERAGFSSTLDRENFTRVANVELDFEVLSREFHSNNR